MASRTARAALDVPIARLVPVSGSIAIPLLLFVATAHLRTLGLYFRTGPLPMSSLLRVVLGVLMAPVGPLNGRWTANLWAMTALLASAVSTALANMCTLLLLSLAGPNAIAVLLLSAMVGAHRLLVVVRGSAGRAMLNGALVVAVLLRLMLGTGAAPLLVA